MAHLALSLGWGWAEVYLYANYLVGQVLEIKAGSRRRSSGIWPLCLFAGTDFAEEKKDWESLAPECNLRLT